MTHEINTEKLLRQEERGRVLRNADERGERVSATIREQHETLAKKLEISPTHLNELLSDPEAWHNFLESRKPQHGEVTINQSGPLNPHLKRRQKTSHRGTVFDTTKWDELFDPKKRGG